MRQINVEMSLQDRQRRKGPRGRSRVATTVAMGRRRVLAASTPSQGRHWITSLSASMLFRNRRHRNFRLRSPRSRSRSHSTSRRVHRCTVVLCKSATRKTGLHQVLRRTCRLRISQREDSRRSKCPECRRLTSGKPKNKDHCRDTWITSRSVPQVYLKDRALPKVASRSCDRSMDRARRQLIPMHRRRNSNTTATPRSLPSLGLHSKPSNERR